MQAELIWKLDAHLGESPVWDEEQARIYSIDSHCGKIFRCAPDGSERRVWQTDRVIGSLCLRRTGGAVLATNRGFEAFDFNTGTLELLAAVATEADVRLNDGKVDPFGNFVCGSFDTKVFNAQGRDPAASPRGAIHRLQPDHQVHTIKRGVGVFNGPCWSPDGSTFYFSDSWSGTITRYPWQEGLVELSAGRDLVTLPLDDGVPDGAAVDSEGYLWSATVLTGELRRYAPDGCLDRRLPTPVKGVTSLAFGGERLDILFATSLKLDGHGPDAGSLFAISGLGVRGTPVSRFQG